MADDLRYVPAEELIRGLELMELPPGYTPLAGMLFLRVLDEEGELAWIYRYSKDLSNQECLGAAQVAAALLTRDIVNAYRPENED